MNWKHFLRGLGAGIIFSTLIMLVAYMTSGSYRISDEEIIERATKLGMVMEDRAIVATSGDGEAVSTDGVVNADGDSSEKQDTETMVGNNSEAVTTEDVSSEANTTEEKATEEKTTEKSGTESTEEAIDSTYVTAEITVSRGMSSEEIAKLVQDAGIIEDYLDFDEYLKVNGYSDKLSVNTFKLNSNMSYEEIAKELTKGDK